MAVVGLVGAGKTSLLSALLGEMETLSGSVRLSGSRAYVAQQAWIQNLTLRDNILFGLPYDPERFAEAVATCGLEPDLKLLAAGDRTEIGENGINLSGGQKQRVALARAVYRRADLYLLDDPLAALDAHVGREVFNRVIGPGGVLAGTTRVLVTHNVAVLKHVDTILVMVEGRVGESGSYTELVNSSGPFSEFLAQYGSEFEEREAEEGGHLPHRVDLHRSVSETYDEENVTETMRTFHRSQVRKVSFQAPDHSGPETTEAEDEKEVVSLAGDTTRLTEDEEALTGQVKWSVYLRYIRAIGLPVFTFNFFMYFATEMFRSGYNIVLARWSDDPDSGEAGVRDAYMAWYGGLGALQAVSCYAKEVILFLACAKASRIIHEKLLSRVMHSPMAFFDTNPTGRILNRFSSDVDTVDQTIPFEIDDFMNCTVETLATLAIITYSTPLFASLLLPLTILYFVIQKFYIASSRQLKRLDRISESPIFSHFTETVSGAPSIRAFNVCDRFVSESERLVGLNNRCLYLSFVSNRWLGVRLENLGNLVVLGAALFAVLDRHGLSGGLAGLSISYSLTLTETLNWLVRMICQLETNCVSLERIFEYEEREEEAAWDTAVDQLVSGSWPERGGVAISGLTVGYRPGLAPVLVNMTADIRPGEKIGVCGRTGAGKSSLALALFRMMEPSSGSVTVDGQDVSRLGLQLLRSRLTVIPQDPVLFSSSLRFNLDPAGLYSDQEVMRCLNMAGLGQLCQQLDQQVKGGNPPIRINSKDNHCCRSTKAGKTSPSVSAS